MSGRAKTGRKISIRLSRFGGFHAPAMAQTTEVDDGGLSDTEYDELVELVKQVEPDPPETSKRRAPDAFVYELDIELDGRRRRIELGDTNMTENQRTLVQWMQERGEKK